MTLNHPFYLMICCSSSEWHFGAVIVKFLLNLILSLFFLLIIRASIWSPCGKNLADPCYYQKDDQFAKYCHTPLNPRFHLVFRCLSSNRHFGTVTLKFLLNPVTKETMTNLQNTVKRLGIIVFSNSIVAQNMANLQNTVTGLLFTVFCWSICAHHVSNILQVTTHKMHSLENIVTRLRIVVLCYSSSAYHHNYTLELLPWNCLSTPLWRKRWPICIILSHVSKSWFSFSYLVLIVWATLWSC